MAVDKNVYQNAGDYTLDGVLIVGSSGEKINVYSQVRELNIYQSIDSPYMSGNIMIADAEGYVLFSTSILVVVSPDVCDIS